MGLNERMVFRAALISGALILMISIVTIPFLFESSSLYYKLGMDKVLLRTGKVTGLLAAYLILFQVIFVSRLTLLEKVFSKRGLYAFHSRSGKIILILAFLHPFCIVAAEHFTFFSLEKRYWPEFLGVGLFFLILLIVAGSVWRKRAGMSQKFWQLFHRWMAPLITMLVFVHILFVSESFKSGVPRAGLGIAGLMALLLFGRIYYKRYFGR